MIDRDGDRRVLAAMAEAGADLSKPAQTIDYLYFSSIDAAMKAEEDLRAAGYENVRVERAPAASAIDRLVHRHRYSCIGEAHAVPEEAAVFATTERMNALAAKRGGEYDGWEASIEK